MGNLDTPRVDGPAPADAPANADDLGKRILHYMCNCTGEPVKYRCGLVARSPHLATVNEKLTKTICAVCKDMAEQKCEVCKA